MLKKQKGNKHEVEGLESRGLSTTVKRIWSYLSAHRSLILLVLVMVIASSGLGLLGPFLIGR
ncbi:MAG TPA: hypothetical protein DCR24_07535, partial [Bacillus bacterium]|nr:hypothetical protein [Bacillus sp. (in: firmicutes)]